MEVKQKRMKLDNKVEKNENENKMDNKEESKNILLSLLINNNEKIIDLSEMENSKKFIGLIDKFAIGMFELNNSNDVEKDLMKLHNKQEKDIENGFIIYVKLTKEKVLLFTLEMFSEIVTLLLFESKFDGKNKSEVSKDDMLTLMKWKKEMDVMEKVPDFLLQVAQLKKGVTVRDVFPQMKTFEFIKFQKRLELHNLKSDSSPSNCIFSSCFGLLQKSESGYTISDVVEDVAKLYGNDIPLSNLSLFIIILAIAPQMIDSFFKTFPSYKKAMETCNFLNCKLTISRFAFVRLIKEIKNQENEKHLKFMKYEAKAQCMSDEVKSLVSLSDKTFKSIDNISNNNNNNNNNSNQISSFMGFFKIAFPFDSIAKDDFENTFKTIKNAIMSNDDDDDDDDDDSRVKKMKFSNDENEEKDEKSNFDDLIVYCPNNLLVNHCKELFVDVRYTPLVLDDANIVKMNKRSVHRRYL